MGNQLLPGRKERKEGLLDGAQEGSPVDLSSQELRRQARKDEAEEAATRLDELPQDPRRIALILLGAGKVGRSLLTQILQHAELHRSLFHIVFDVVAVSDSTAALLLEDASQVRTVVEWKERGQALVHHSRATLIPNSQALVEAVAEPGAIVIDCTASDNAHKALLRGLSKGCHIVMANKKPLSLSQQTFRTLTGPSPGAARARWGATVGAGLPVITSLNRFRAAGDEINRIRGCLSSTLGTIFSGLEGGEELSRLIREAIQKGVAEPDPREDLSGRDLARKALILARTAGWRAELSEVAVESLYPASMEGQPVEEFLSRISMLDQELERRQRQARDRGRCLRYVMDVGPEGIRVGPQEVSEDSPLARLQGSEQLISIESSIYQEAPMIIQGRGAGVEATAAGVLSDILELAMAGCRPAE